MKEAQARYDAKDDECWKYQNNPELRYKLREERHNLSLAVKEARKMDPKIKEQPRILKRRKRLAGFYKQQYPYLLEFGQAYPIFKEEGAGDNPLRIAHTLNTLENYKESSLQYPKKLHRHFKGSIEEKRGNHPYTNKQFLERSFHWLVNAISFGNNLMPGKTPPSPEQANRMGKRLAEEVGVNGWTDMASLAMGLGITGDKQMAGDVD